MLLPKLYSFWCVKMDLVLKSTSDCAFLCGNVAFLILVLSTKERYSNFLKKVFVFQKNCFKVKVLKTFKNFLWFSHKYIPAFQTEGYFENPWYRFLEQAMLLLWALKRNLWLKALSFFKTNANSNFAVKLAKRNNRPFSVYLMNHRVQTSVHFNTWQRKTSWLSKHMKKVRYS